jgi:hypothetical protein
MLHAVRRDIKAGLPWLDAAAGREGFAESRPRTAPSQGTEGMAMEALLAITLIGTLFVLPLGLRAWSDRKQAHAERIGAEIRAAVHRRLRGESLLAIHVEPAGLWHPGRVVLDAPSGYEDLAEAAWPAVVPRVPEGYELVMKPGRRAAGPEPTGLRRAA